MNGPFSRETYRVAYKFVTLVSRFVFVKCKAHGKSPRANQLREHGRLLALGFDVVVLDRKNMEGII